MAFGGVYKSGTISVTANAMAVSGAGTLWSVAQIEAGDILFANGAVGVINSVTDDTNLVLESAWSGGALLTSAYVILKTSWTRYDPALVQSKVRLLLATLQTPTVMYGISGTGAVPDPGLGEDGQYAAKLDTAPWKIWLRVAGEWVQQAAPFAVGGDVYDIGGFSPDRPGSGENILSWLFNRPVTFAAGLADSRAKCGTASTATAVFSIQKNGVEFGTIAIAASGTTGTFASASGASFTAGDILDVVGPSPRDATLADMHVTLFGYR